MEKLDYLIEYLLKESGRGKFDYFNRDKKSLYRALVNIRQANPISEDILKVEDEYLQEELKMKKITDSKDIKTINDIINAIFNDFQDSTDISWLTIQAINYTGPEENIPTVFYNLNTGGVTLSKYETFAALWDRKKYS